MPADEKAWHRIVDALSAGAVKGADPGPFKRYETHVSVVLVSPRIAYKLKKPDASGAVDYGSVERRRDLCREEVRLNRRLAPDVYLGTAALLIASDGVELVPDVPGQTEDASEWAVEMKYVDAASMLSRRVDLDQVTEPELRSLGTMLAGFHLDAPPAGGDAGRVPAIGRWLDSCVSSMHEVGDEIVGAVRIDAFAGFVRHWLAHRGERLGERADEGWVRDGHGDLRLEHVIVEDGSIAVLDCVEFDPTLRETDVLADLAFLVMELELARRPDLVQALTLAWREAGGPMDEELLWFFAACKAFVRAEVASHRAGQLADGIERALVVDMARAHMSLAERLAWRIRRPTVLLVTGLSGSGKTTVSKLLAERWGVTRVASDEVRKHLVGVREHELAPDHAYADEVSEFVYGRLGTLAGAALASEQSAVIEATFRRAEDRDRFQRALAEAGGSGADILSVRLHAPHTLLRARVRRREEDGGPDAGLAVLEEQLAEDQPNGDELPGQAFEVDAGDSTDSVAAQIDLQVLGRAGLREIVSGSGSAEVES